MKPLQQYFSGYYDIISIHADQGDHIQAKENVDAVEQYAGGKYIWVTERDSTSNTASDVTNIYVDQHNRLGYWTKIFYDLGGYGDSCSNPITLLCSNDGVTLTQTALFSAYQSVYAPH